jgi:hypothetical protein
MSSPICHPRFLHIHCGDSSADILRESPVPGDILVWREIYIEGPAPGNVPDEEFCRIRADFISNAVRLDYDAVLSDMNASYTALAEAGKYKEVILWFDSCMFDQTIMIHLIELCAARKWPETKLSLICIDRGLGLLSMEELASLLDTRHEVTPAEISLAENAWKAFASNNPAAIERLIEKDCSVLPYLKDAMFRHLEQFPSVRNGLNRTQNQLMKVVNSGTVELMRIFRAVSAMEERPFMGDTSLWACIDELAGCAVPLLRLDGSGRLKDLSAKEIQSREVSITDAGKEVLAGQRDYIRLNKIDRWLGGVHLQGREAQWRWDEQRRKLVPGI